MQLNELIDKLKNAFSIYEVKKIILDKEWLEKNINSGIDSTGFCFAACQVIYKLSGQKERWTVKIISKKIWKHGSHYYLQDKITKEILDITSDQYTQNKIAIPYKLGKGIGIRGFSKGKSLADFIGVKIN